MLLFGSLVDQLFQCPRPIAHVRRHQRRLLWSILLHENVGGAVDIENVSHANLTSEVLSSDAAPTWLQILSRDPVAPAVLALLRADRQVRSLVRPRGSTSQEALRLTGCCTRQETERGV